MSSHGQLGFDELRRPSIFRWIDSIEYSIDHEEESHDQYPELGQYLIIVVINSVNRNILVILERKR
jgi:hypothetical protein